MSMATFAARRLQPMIANTAHILGIELLAAAQGIDFLRPLDELGRARGGARAAARALPADADTTATSRPTSSAPPRWCADGALARVLRTLPGLARALDVSGLNLHRSPRKERRMKKTCRPGSLAAAGLIGMAQAQETKVAIGISGWTGFAPLTLAKEAGLFKKHGLDVDDQEDPAEGPPPRDRLGRHPVRRDHGRDLDRAGTPTASRRRRSSSSTRATAPTAWW